MAILGVALRPNNEAPRQTLAGVERGATNYISLSTDKSTAQSLQFQRLAALGLSAVAVTTIAPMVFGSAAHG